MLRDASGQRRSGRRWATEYELGRAPHPVSRGTQRSLCSLRSLRSRFVPRETGCGARLVPIARNVTEGEMARASLAFCFGARFAGAFLWVSRRSLCSLVLSIGCMERLSIRWARRSLCSLALSDVAVSAVRGATVLPFLLSDGERSFATARGLPDWPCEGPAGLRRHLLLFLRHRVPSSRITLIFNQLDAQSRIPLNSDRSKLRHPHVRETQQASTGAAMPPRASLQRLVAWPRGVGADVPRDFRAGLLEALARCPASDGAMP